MLSEVFMVPLIRLVICGRYLINSQVLDFLSPNLSENERNKTDKKPRNRNSKTSPLAKS